MSQDEYDVFENDGNFAESEVSESLLIENKVEIERRRVLEVYTDQVMKAATVQDVNANASKGATLNEMLFTLLSTLAWSAVRRGDQ